MTQPSDGKPLSLDERILALYYARATAAAPASKEPTGGLSLLLTPEYLAAAVAEDVYTPRAGELIRCWRCYRTALLLWTPGIWRCGNSGACRRFFLAAESNFSASPTRSHCRRCPGLVLFRLRAATATRAAERECCRCHEGQLLTFPLGRVGLLTSPEDRAALRAAGDLSAEGGPTFRRAKIQDRTEALEREAARLGTAQAYDKARRYRYQLRRRRDARIKRGQAPDLDARRFRL
jgi:hypothetical protein